MADNGFMENISELDFEKIKIKLMNAEVGEGWTLEYCNRVEKEYKKFLALKRKYPDDLKIVPSSSIDVFWHYHILDTQKYVTDCEAVFGKYLHHNPYFGLNGKFSSEFTWAWMNTRSMYEEHFGILAEEELWELPFVCG